MAACPAPPPPEEATPPPPQVYRIGETYIVTHPALQAAQRGFHDALAEEGFLEGENVVYIVQSPEGDMSLAASIGKSFVSQKVDLIHAISTPSAQACVASAEGTGIPVVFDTVTDGVAAGLIPSFTQAAPFVTGVSDNIEDQIPPSIKLLMDICPDTKRLGLVYNAGEVNAQLIVEQVRKIAPGFGLTIVEATVATTADVYAAAMSLVGRVDAIYNPGSNTTESALESVIKVADENNIPVLGFDQSSPERGCLAAAATDYYYSGAAAGHMAARILRGEKPANITPERMQVMGPVVNLTVAQRLGLTIPQSILEKATIVK
jgi:putative ABC transport system substrate-binding protein